MIPENMQIRAAGAENGVDDDREHLDETLLGRVGKRQRRSCVRSRTNAGFVGIKAALYPKHQTGSADAAQDFLEVEGIGKRQRLRRSESYQDA